MSPIWVMGGLCACFETDTTKCLNKDPSSFGICYGAPVTPEVAHGCLGFDAARFRLLF